MEYYTSEGESRLLEHLHFLAGVKLRRQGACSQTSLPLELGLFPCPP